MMRRRALQHVTTSRTTSRARPMVWSWVTAWVAISTVAAVSPPTWAKATEPPIASGCQLISTDTTIDYGRFSPHDLPPPPPGATALPLGKRTLTLHATCDTSQRMTLFFHGNAVADNTFRFGDTRDADKKGQLVVRLVRAQLDGKPTAMGLTRATAIPPEAFAPSLELAPGFGATVNGAGRQLSVQVELEAFVPRTAMRPRHDETWQSDGQFMLDTRSDN